MIKLLFDGRLIPTLRAKTTRLSPLWAIDGADDRLPLQW